MSKNVSNRDCVLQILNNYKNLLKEWNNLSQSERSEILRTTPEFRMLYEAFIGLKRG